MAKRKALEDELVQNDPPPATVDPPPAAELPIVNREVTVIDDDSSIDGESEEDGPDYGGLVNPASIKLANLSHFLEPTGWLNDELINFGLWCV